LAISIVKHGLVEESMRRTVLAAVFALSVSAVLSVGCGAGGPPAANSFTKVYTETVQPKCSNNFCHYNGVSIQYSALDLSSKVRAYWSLVGLPCMGNICSQRGTRVVPGQPEASMMYLKVSQESPPCGLQMPADTTFRTNGISELMFTRCPDAAQPAPNCREATLPAEEQLRIHDWIQEGAQNN
jgi:hypothetical protein